MAITSVLTPELLLKWLTLTVMLAGLFSLVFLPGLVIIWAAALGYGLLAGFGTLGWVMFAVLTVLMIAGGFVDNLLMGSRAHKEGAPWWAVLAAMLASVAGNFALPIVGGIAAALLVLFLIEWLRRRDWRKALSATRGMLIGCGWAFVIRFIMGLIMIGLWLVWAGV